jgi:ABC-type uncharacterized transport system permease subunit
VNCHSNNLRFARALLATNVKATLMLRGAFVVQVVFMALNNLTFFVFWWALMRRVPDLRGWRLGDMQMLFGVVAAGFGAAMTLAGGVRHLGRFIDEGELDTLLTQPKPVLVHALGMRLQASGFGDALSGIAFIACSGQVSWRALPVVVLAIVASALVLVASGIVFFSLAFWLGPGGDARAAIMGAVDHVFAVPGAIVRGSAASRPVYAPAGGIRRLRSRAPCPEPVYRGWAAAHRGSGWLSGNWRRRLQPGPQALCVRESLRHVRVRECW